MITLEEFIATGMARAIWVLKYADFVEEHPGQGYAKPHGGGNWEDAAPETPDAANKAAFDLYELFTSVNAGDSLQSKFEAYIAKPQPKTKDKLKLETYFDELYTLAEDFGADMAMEAMGTGVSWFDDHPTFPVVFPRFEVYFDGSELSWEGGERQGGIKGKPGRGKARATKVGTVYQYVVIMVNGDRGDTYAAELDGNIDDEFAVSEAIEDALEMANPDQGSRIDYAIVASEDAGSARLLHGELLQDWTEFDPEEVLPEENPKRKTKGKRWKSSEVQSLMFDKDLFTESKAKAWAKKNGFLYGKVDTTEKYHRLRQFDPAGAPCATKELTKGVRAVICST